MAINVVGRAVLIVGVMLLIGLWLVQSEILFSTVKQVEAVEVKPSGIAGNFELIFQDEFEGNSLDTSKWHPCYFWSKTTCTNDGNQELGLYTADNLAVANGALSIFAREEDRLNWDGRRTFGYTSGLIITGGSTVYPPKAPSFAMKYGVAEARIWVPKGQGLWPAFWLLAQDYDWPPEIDVMELLGHEPQRIHMSLHYNDLQGTHKSSGQAYAMPSGDYSTGWHTFAVDWQPDYIDWYIDGVKRRSTYSDSRFIPQEPMYLVVNLAVGGGWPGPPDQTTMFPAEMKVDYVRAFRRVAANDGGQAPSSTPSPAVIPTNTPRPTVTVTPVPTSIPTAVVPTHLDVDLNGVLDWRDLQAMLRGSTSSIFDMAGLMRSY